MEWSLLSAVVLRSLLSAVVLSIFCQSCWSAACPVIVPMQTDPCRSGPLRSGVVLQIDPPHPIPDACEHGTQRAPCRGNLVFGSEHTGLVSFHQRSCLRCDAGLCCDMD